MRTTHEGLYVKDTVVRRTNFIRTPHEQIQSHFLRQFSNCHMHKDGRPDTQIDRYDTTNRLLIAALL